MAHNIMITYSLLPTIKYLHDYQYALAKAMTFTHSANSLPNSYRTTKHDDLSHLPVNGWTQYVRPLHKGSCL